MKPERHPHWGNAILQAEADLARNMPTVWAARQKYPNWQPQWIQHRSLQITELAEWCYQHQPKVILELGSGWTTFVMARYACEFRSRLVAVEENNDWRTSGVLGDLPDWAHVNWWMSRVTGDNVTRHYEELPPDLPEIDLLYVDGPNCDAFGRSMIGSDAVRVVEAGARPKHVLFDMRHNAVDLFRERVEGYHWEPGGSYELSKPWYLRACRHHSWFWRK